MNHLVFVYGTLRQGCSNHGLLKDEKYLGTARTKDRYALYVDDYPYLVKDQPRSRVKGEVYQVSTQGLARLDILENHPAWYKREKIRVCLDMGEVILAWIYFFPTARGRLVSGGDYLQSSLGCSRTGHQALKEEE
ncbi:gamma-glutamylcyclotransferase family protein [Desulfonatronovibrio hydrogenovorans]|uniref:gamma-glutamylcyclotransferase family protein n=1 Tax=Desulfonatronovibrio hydrogenovorans TaxID=53245 RepID=UPI0004907C97|nr:gamma-glutamylcyclotransferase family protein [Desulfonatronovibrio hydrogenovorans]